ncbi:MAG: galactokinase family protein [Gaiellaceae bacterium]
MQRSFWAPGRVNLIGDHTDYAGGLVLPIAVDLGIRLIVEPAERIVLVSDGRRVDVAADGTGEVEGWGRYPAAVAAELAELGRPAVGIEGTIEADLLVGAGLGSSAALEVAVGLALCAVADFELDRLELASACRRAELRAVGVPCGIMDQATSLLGRVGTALLLDCDSLDYRHVRLPDELAVLVIDSGERHTLEHTGYAERQRELASGMPARVRHVATENQRVRDTVAALERGEVKSLRRLFRESHQSLRDDYEVSTPELDRLVDVAYESGALAARLTGGGFGGSIVVVAESDGVPAILERLRGRVVRTSDGAHELTPGDRA